MRPVTPAHPDCNSKAKTTVKTAPESKVRQGLYNFRYTRIKRRRLPSVSLAALDLISSHSGRAAEQRDELASFQLAKLHPLAP
jgi:hypothetical protein